MATLRNAPPQAADVVTYRLGDDLVYVKPTDTHEEAIAVAQKEFPVLQSTDATNISFFITASLQGQRRTVRISESAWPSAIPRLLRGEVIDIIVNDPHQKLDVPVTTRRASDAAREPPPRYLAVPVPEHEERSRHVRTTKSNPGSRRNSPSPGRVSLFFGRN